VTGKAIPWQEGTCLITQVDRLSGYLVGGKATRKARAEVNEATKKALAGRVVLTVTLDRGKEFLDAEGLQEALGAPVYFCHPHHLWERGTNENTNGLLRDWFSKGQSFDDVDDRKVQEVYDSLNQRQPKTAQAPGVEVSLGGLPSPVVTLALRIRRFFLLMQA